MRVVTIWLKLESRSFHHKVALYHNYLPIKFDDDIQGGPLIGGSQNRVGVVFNFVPPYLEDGAG